MVATSIMSTDAEMNSMAGANVDTTGWDDANKTAWGLQAENYLNNLTRKNLSDLFASLSVDVKSMLSEFVARYTALQGISYNFLGDGGNTKTRVESEDQINVHVWRMREIIRILTNKGTITFMEAAA